MFKFEVHGELKGIQEGADGRAYLRLQPETNFRFRRDGEIPDTLQVEVPPALIQQVKGLGFGAMVEVTGIGAVGKHDWSKKEFGEVKTRTITNYYFQATAVKVLK